MVYVEEQDRDPNASELEAEIAQACGLMNATTAHLVRLIARVLELGTWQSRAYTR